MTSMQQAGVPVEPRRSGYASELVRLLAQVAALERQVAALRQELAVVSAQQVERVHAVVAVGEGVDDGGELDWHTLEQACLEMADAALGRLDSLEALLDGVDDLMAATGRALLTAVTAEAPIV